MYCYLDDRNVDMTHYDIICIYICIYVTRCIYIQYIYIYTIYTYIQYILYIREIYIVYDI